jgi:hypothetical protein
VAELDPEVIDVLVRIMKGAVNPDELDERSAVSILAMCADPRTAAYVASTWLNDQGLTFEQIAERVKAEYNIDVHRSTVARWAKRPDVDRRRRRRTEDDGNE